MAYRSRSRYVNRYGSNDQPRSRRRRDPIRIAFVDFSGTVHNPEMMIDPSLPYHEFLTYMTEMSATVAYLLPGLSHPKFPGQGLTLADGPWQYRVVKPFEYDIPRTTFYRGSSRGNYAGRQNGGQYVHHNVRRTGIDADDWALLDSMTAYQRMIDRMFYGYRLQGAWIEVQHWMQKERDERNWSMANLDGHMLNHAFAPVDTSFQASMDVNFSMNWVQNGIPPMQPIHMLESDPYMGFGLPPGPGHQQLAIEGPIVADGGRPTHQRANEKSSFTPTTDSIAPTTPFTWKPPTPGVLIAPGVKSPTTATEQTAVPPTITSLPTTIDPALLFLDQSGRTPRVNIPHTYTSNGTDGKFIGDNGQELVFGRQNEPLTETASVSDDDTIDDPANFEQVQEMPLKDVDDGSSLSKSQSNTVRTPLNVVEKDQTKNDGNRAAKEVQGNMRGRGNGRVTEKAQRRIHGHERSRDETT